MTILNVDPGGWSPENATPERARISPVLGRMAAMPPSRPARASTAAVWTLGAIDVRTSVARFADPRAEVAAAGAQHAAG